jgi:hypothetical protein
MLGLFGSSLGTAKQLPLELVDDVLVADVLVDPVLVADVLVADVLVADVLVADVLVDDVPPPVPLLAAELVLVEPLPVAPLLALDELVVAPPAPPLPVLPEVLLLAPPMALVEPFPADEQAIAEATSKAVTCAATRTFDTRMTTLPMRTEVIQLGGRSHRDAGERSPLLAAPRLRPLCSAPSMRLSRVTLVVALALLPALAPLPALADTGAPPAKDAKPQEQAGKPGDAKPADAKPDPAKLAAQKLADLIKKGTDACAAGDLDEGVPSLRAAWAQHQDADLAVVLANCEIKASDWPGAAEHLAFALRVKEDPEQRKALEASFLNVRARVGAVKVTVNVDGADVFVGERFAGTAPLPGEVYVAPGRARISAKKTGYGEVEGRVDVAAQGTATLALDLAGEGVIASSHRPMAARSRTPAYVLGALGLVAAGVGAGFWAAGAAKGGAADSLLAELQMGSSQPCFAGTLGCQTLKDLRSTHDTYVNIGTGVLIGSGALLAATLVYGLWATATPTPDRQGIGVTPVAAPGGAALFVHGTF